MTACCVTYTFACRVTPPLLVRVTSSLQSLQQFCSNNSHQLLQQLSCCCHSNGSLQSLQQFCSSCHTRPIPLKKMECLKGRCRKMGAFCCKEEQNCNRKFWQWKRELLYFLMYRTCTVLLYCESLFSPQ